MIGNYVDPTATTTVDLGPCRCPHASHGNDSATVVALFGYGDRGVIRQAGRMGGPEAFKLMALLRGVKSWSLGLPNGSPRPIDAQQLERLDEGTVDLLIAALDPAFDEDPLPNESGDPSPNGSPASDSSTPTTSTPSLSTTR